MNADEFAKWVADVQWREAKTMPDIPHEYTVIAWGNRDQFIEAAKFIRAHGFKARWRNHSPKPYYELGGRIYWAFQSVINRCDPTDPTVAVERVDSARD